MGVEYTLVNHTKKEEVAFTHVPASKAKEIAGNPAAATIVVWYMLHNRGDEITFLSDEDIVSLGLMDTLDDYVDVTDQIVNECIANGILEDRGILYKDGDDQNIYLRDLRNVWLENL